MTVLIIGLLDRLLRDDAGPAGPNGIAWTRVADIGTALARLRSGPISFILCDMCQDVLALLAAMNEAGLDVPVIVCGTAAQADAAALAMRAGARSFLLLPPRGDISAMLLGAFADAADQAFFETPGMAPLLQRVAQVAGSDVPILITGESGTGKDVLAACIHRRSRRSAAPLVTLSCAGMPDELLDPSAMRPESSAVAHLAAKLEAAKGGTLVLNEIGELDARLQAKLLHILQDRGIDRSGRDASALAEMRIIATTSRDLQKDVRQGLFRPDVFFRLNVVALKLPPLRERLADLPALVQGFLKKFADAEGRACRTITPQAMAILMQHDWPGNMRELSNVIHRAVLLTAGDAIPASAIDIEPLDADGTEDGQEESPVGSSSDDAPPLGTLVGRTIADVEKDLILATLCRHFGNRSQAAGVLGISIRTLRNKLHEYERGGTRIPRPVVVGLA